MGLKTWSRAFAVYKRLPFRFKDTNTLKIKEYRKVNFINSNQKGAGVATLIADKVDFKTKKNVTRDKEGHFIVMKG